MEQLPMVLENNNQYNYDLLLIREDSYSEDAKQFVIFLKENNLPISLKSLQAYANYLNQENNGMRYAANSYNKKIQGAKERIKYLFYHSRYASDKVACYHFVESLKTVKLKKINSVAVNRDMLLTEEEVQTLINGSTDRTVSLVVDFLFATGLRISEMLNILLTDMKRDNNKYTIRILGKRAKERKIFVSIPLIEKVLNATKGSRYLFEHSGKQYSRISMSRRISMQGKIVLRKNISAHTLRHSFATSKLAKTNNLKGVSKYLGHSSISTTANLYVHSELSYDDLF
jgi:integrase/recombinase XerD